MSFASPHLLRDCLRYRRPAGSKTEKRFIREVLQPQISAAGRTLYADGYDNLYTIIGAGNPTVMWSCHLDTVHRKGGLQSISESGAGFLSAPEASSNCLGADDGAGIWIMLEMIAAQRPGLYVFHREEEHGGKGSHWIADNNSKLLTGIQYAIALDRAGTSSVITHQGGRRTASDEFGKALAAKLGRGYKLDQGGTFTDTKSYVDLVPECTNLSVGYFSAHCADERLDIGHVMALRDVMLKLDLTGLPASRNPKVTEFDRAFETSAYSGYGYKGGYTPSMDASGSAQVPDLEVTTIRAGQTWKKGYWVPFFGWVNLPWSSPFGIGEKVPPHTWETAVREKREARAKARNGDLLTPSPSTAATAPMTATVTPLRPQPVQAVAVSADKDWAWRSRVAKMARENPFAVCDLLEDFGIDEDDLVTAVLARGHTQEF